MKCNNSRMCVNVGRIRDRQNKLTKGTVLAGLGET